MIRNLLGPDGHTSIPIAKFDKPFALAKLIQATAIIVDENPVGAFAKDLGDFKSVITGDEFTLERKYQDPLAVSFNGQVIQCVNDFPKSRDKSSSYARRQLFVPFRNHFGGDGVERKYIKHDYLKRSDVLEYVLKEALHMDHTAFSNPPACQALLLRFQQENSPVVAFWLEHADDYVWDFLPGTFLYDVYKAWFDRSNPTGSKLGRNEFFNELEAYLDNQPGFNLVRKKTRPGTRMDAPERLIETYDLTDWMNPGAKTSLDWQRRCCPVVKSSYNVFVERVAPNAPVSRMI